MLLDRNLLSDQTKNRDTFGITVDDNTTVNLELRAGAKRDCHGGKIFDFHVKKNFQVAKQITVQNCLLIGRHHADINKNLPSWATEYGKGYVYAVVPKILSEMHYETGDRIYTGTIFGKASDGRPVMQLQLFSAKCFLSENGRLTETVLPNLQGVSDAFLVKATVKLYGTEFSNGCNLKIALADFILIDRLQGIHIQLNTTLKKRLITEVETSTSQRSRYLLGMDSTTEEAQQESEMIDR